MTLIDRIAKLLSKKNLRTEKTGQNSTATTPTTHHTPRFELLRQNWFYPTSLLLLTLVSVLFAETILNIIFQFYEFQSAASFHDRHSEIVISLIDAGITTIIAFPIIYFLLFRRIRSQFLQLKELQSSLETSEAAFREIVQDQSELICRMDKEGNIVFANQAFCLYFSCMSRAIIGSNFIEFFQEEVGNFRDQFADLNADHPFKRRDYQQTFADGTIRWLSMAIRAFYDGGGLITHYQAVGRDITDLKEMLAELEDARRNLEEKVRLRTVEVEVLGNASRSLTRSLEEDQVTTALFNSIQQIVPQAVRIMLFKPENSMLQLLAVRNEGKDGLPTSISRVSQAENELLQEIIDSRQPLLIDNASRHPAWKDKPAGGEIGSWLGLPILVAGNLIGVCKMETNSGQSISPRSRLLVEALIGQAAVAIQNARLFGEVRSAKTKLQALSRKMVEVQEVERRFISRELHDETSQALMSLVFALEVLKRDAGNPIAVAARVDELDHLVDDILNNLNRLAVDLRPAALDHLGLLPAIRQYVAGIRDKYKLEIQLELPEMSTRLPPDMETALYRIIQEALANIIRHAQASQAEIRLEIMPNTIHVHINDDGVGFSVLEALESGRLGIFGMRERAEMIGGKLDIQSSPGFGTRLILEVPYDYSGHNR